MTDSDFLLGVLSERPGEWVRHITILNRSFSERGCGLTVHSRAATLRSKGFDVECKVEADWQGLGRRESFYRIIPALSVAPASLPQAAGVPAGVTLSSECRAQGEGAEGAAEQLTLVAA